MISRRACLQAMTVGPAALLLACKRSKKTEKTDETSKVPEVSVETTWSPILIAAPNRSVRLDTDNDGVVEIDRMNCGVVYLIYGSPNLRGTLSLSAIGTEQLPGAVFIGRNSGDQLGAGLGEHGDRSHSIAPAGDVDGDGNDDILLGSVTASPRNRERAGEAYLIYGTGD